MKQYVLLTTLGRIIIMNAVYLVVTIAIIQYIYFAILVGKARETYGVKAPLTSGNEQFERLYRIQMNTMELLVVFIPLIFITAFFWNPNFMAVLGSIFIFGRMIYAKKYLENPDTRTVGFILSMGPILIFILLVLAGIIKSQF
jgi:hypothetical protein